jgi:polynucleotide 5'-kinase involved in rRNA processing
MINLAHSRLPRILGSKNRFHYGDIEWNNDPDGPGGLSEETHAEYLQQFATDFERSVCELIDRQVTKLDKIPKDPLYIEVLEHAHTCVKKCERFVGRQEILEEVETYIHNKSRQPLIVYGGSGCGKTSVLAMIAKMVSSQIVNDVVNTLQSSRHIQHST